MRLNSEGLRELYQRETARSSRRAENDCLEEDLLARAAAGELSQSERERTADHLAMCSDCAKEYHAISSLKSWTDGMSEDPGLSSQNREGPPIRLLASAHSRQPGPFPFEGRSRGPGVARPFYLPYAIAAALLVLSLVLGALLVSKSRENQRLIAQAQAEATRNAGSIKAAESLTESRQLLAETTRRAEQESEARRLAEEELARRDAAAKSSSRGRQNPVPGQRGRTEDQFSMPDVNVPIFDLDPHDGERGEENAEATAIELPPDTNLFTLILNPGSEQSSGGYSIEVMDSNNKTVWVGRGLRKSRYNNFTIAMRRRSFPAGVYRLNLYGVRDGSRHLIEEYAIRLAYR